MLKFIKSYVTSSCFIQIRRSSCNTRERNLRLSASNFGKVCKCKKNPEKLAKGITKSPSGSPNTASLYGLRYERDALKAYEKMTGQQVTRCGVFVDLRREYLAASPDGVVGDHKVIEVKCPYRAREMTPVEAATFLVKPKFYCSLVGSDSLVLSRCHNYYYQVQGQLGVTGRKICDFVVWTPLGIHVESIPRDELFISNMYEKLDNFYHKILALETMQSEHNNK